MQQKMRERAESLRILVRSCAPGKLVFLGGAGVSTESGIPDFRSANGLYSQGGEIAPETIISHHFFEEHPAQFYDFYCENMLPGEAEPNAAHRKLAELEAQGLLRCVITQNIDGLHTAAGSREVYELHGSVHRNRCRECGAPYGLEELLAAREAADDGVPRCTCGGVIKPEVILYEEALDEGLLAKSVEAIGQADVLIVAGTSLTVYPVAGLLQYFKGRHLVLINLDSTPLDKAATLRIKAKVGEVMSSL